MKYMIGTIVMLLASTSALAGNEDTQSAAPSGTLDAGQQAKGVQEIVVTAQKRSQSIQSIPIAVSAFSGSSMAATGITNVQALAASIPNVNIGQQVGVAQIAIRGIGLDSLATAVEGSVAVNKNNVFMSRPVAALSSFYDVERVEVLRGPQGTLYGRNATAGSINIITRDPTATLSGYEEATVGNYGEWQTTGALSGPLAGDTLLARVAYDVEGRGGYGENIANGSAIDNLRTQAVRTTIVAKPSDRLKVKLIGDFHREHDASGGYHYFGAAGVAADGSPLTPTGIALGGTAAPDIRDVSNSTSAYFHERDAGVTADISYSLGDITLRSITAGEFVKYVSNTDLDGTDYALAPLTQGENSRQFSQELQASGSTPSSQWLVGLYYFHEFNRNFISISPYNDSAFGGPGVQRQGFLAGGTLKTDAGAAFGQYRRRLTSALSVTIGARYSIERKAIDNSLSFDLTNPYSVSGPRTYIGSCAVGEASDICVPHKTFKAFTPRFVVEYKVNPQVLFYASASKGFKSGTYNMQALQRPVDPETVWAYEAGIKSTFLGGLLRTNATGFYYNYSNLQVNKIVNAGQILENAAKARIWGIELEMTAKPTDRLELNLSASRLDAKFRKFVSVDPARPAGDGVTMDDGVPAFNLAGNTLERSPKWTLDATAQYHVPVGRHTLTLVGDYAYTSKVYFSPFDRDIVAQDGHSKINASIRLNTADGRWEISAFARNILNKTIKSSVFVSSSLVGYAALGFLEEPRIYGLRAKYTL
jgi:iron complex outermembrane receptor protein